MNPYSRGKQLLTLALMKNATAECTAGPVNNVQSDVLDEIVTDVCLDDTLNLDVDAVLECMDTTLDDKENDAQDEKSAPGKKSM